jgi:hypothetical protein
MLLADIATIRRPLEDSTACCANIEIAVVSSEPFIRLRRLRGTWPIVEL